MRRDRSSYNGRVCERWASAWTTAVLVLTVVVLLATYGFAFALMLGLWSA
jgi:hypothetical protein